MEFCLWRSKTPCELDVRRSKVQGPWLSPTLGPALVHSTSAAKRSQGPARGKFVTRHGHSKPGLCSVPQRLSFGTAKRLHPDSHLDLLAGIQRVPSRDASDRPGKRAPCHHLLHRHHLQTRTALGRLGRGTKFEAMAWAGDGGGLNVLLCTQRGRGSLA